MPQDEAWSWKKLFKGFLIGKNYAKAVVMLFCMAVILTVCVSIYSFVKSQFVKPAQTQAVGTNEGTMNTTNSNKESKNLSLINVLCKN